MAQLKVTLKKSPISQKQDQQLTVKSLGLRKLRNKSLENPWKKHDNIPL